MTMPADLPTPAPGDRDRSVSRWRSSRLAVPTAAVAAAVLTFGGGAAFVLTASDQPSAEASRSSSSAPVPTPTTTAPAAGSTAAVAPVASDADPLPDVVVPAPDPGLNSVQLQVVDALIAECSADLGTAAPVGAATGPTSDWTYLTSGQPATATVTADYHSGVLVESCGGAEATTDSETEGAGAIPPGGCLHEGEYDYGVDAGAPPAPVCPQ